MTRPGKVLAGYTPCRVGLFGRFPPPQFARDCEAEINSGGNPTAGNAVAVNAHTRVDRYGTECRQEFHRSPVRRSPVTSEQTCRTKYERSGADRCHVLRLVSLPTNKV